MNLSEPVVPQNLRQHQDGSRNGLEMQKQDCGSSPSIFTASVESVVQPAAATRCTKDLSTTLQQDDEGFHSSNDGIAQDGSSHVDCSQLTLQTHTSNVSSVSAEIHTLVTSLKRQGFVWPVSSKTIRSSLCFKYSMRSTQEPLL